MRRSVAVLGVVLVSALLSSCGGGDSRIRTVLVDYEHDDVASSFLSYYPTNVRVHPGDTVRFKQTWTGEPHSVTMGAVVDDLFKFSKLFEEYESEEDARAGGVSQETIDQVNATFTHIPGMTDDKDIYQPGARPCFVTKVADLPLYAAEDGDTVLHGPKTKCPTEGRPQPAFTGRQALYNSGYIPWQGSGANEFVVKIAKNATPGTYNYFCNYHWTEMSGKVIVAPASKTIPSSGAVSHAALKQIRDDAKKPLAAARKALKTYEQTGRKVLAGTDDSGDEDPRYVAANEFFPAKLRTKVGEPITWSFKGLAHTISFNVPAYFPVFTVDKKGNVHYDKRAQDPVRWTVPNAVGEHGEFDPRNVDVGAWDGGGGFHSSGLLNEGDTFSITFTKAGTYPYACVIHPPMIGQVVVTA